MVAPLAIDIFGVLIILSSTCVYVCLSVCLSVCVRMCVCVLVCIVAICTICGGAEPRNHVGICTCRVKRWSVCVTAPLSPSPACSPPSVGSPVLSSGSIAPLDWHFPCAVSPSPYEVCPSEHKTGNKSHREARSAHVQYAFMEEDASGLTRNVEHINLC